MKHHRFLFPAFFLIVVLLFSVSCAGQFEKRLAKKQQDLLEEMQEHVNAYNRMIVWGDYDGASMAVVPEKRIEFLEQSQNVAARVNIENYTVPLCQVGIVPFPRDESIPGKEDDAEPKTPTTLTPPAEGGVPAPKPQETPPPPEEGKKKKKEKKKMPKVFYGVALVRYINMTVAPSVTVRTKLIKQHWVYVDETWYCDADLQELME
jgi:hypothetical protein